jgi:hypothetical protein
MGEEVVRVVYKILQTTLARVRAEVMPKAAAAKAAAAVRQLEQSLS